MDEPHDLDREPIEPIGPHDAVSSSHAPPGAMLRFIVVVMGAFTFAMGRAVQQAGGVFGVGLGALIEIVGVGIVAIAIGAVEWFARRVRRSGAVGPR
jgi:hypothetical protein